MRATWGPSRMPATSNEGTRAKRTPLKSASLAKDAPPAGRMPASARKSSSKTVVEAPVSTKKRDARPPSDPETER